MPHIIRPAMSSDLPDLVHMTSLSFEPIFTSFKRVMGDDIYDFVYPDWKKAQKETVETYFTNPDKYHAWVAEVDGILAGLLVLVFDEQSKTGELEFLMVHPDHQKRGIAASLNAFTFDKMREHGMELVAVGTGGDDGHAAARRAYEKAGYTALPIVRYYKKL